MEKNQFDETAKTAGIELSGKYCSAFHRQKDDWIEPPLASDRDGGSRPFLPDALWGRRNSEGRAQRNVKDTLQIIPIMRLFVQDAIGLYTATISKNHCSKAYIIKCIGEARSKGVSVLTKKLSGNEITPLLMSYN